MTSKKVTKLQPPLRAVKAKMQKKAVIKVLYEPGGIQVKREQNDANSPKPAAEPEEFVRTPVVDSWEY